MTGVLSWVSSAEGLTFTIVDGDSSVAVSQWGEGVLQSLEGLPADPGPLFRIVDDDDGASVDDSTVLVPWALVARFTANEAKLLGLPPLVPWTLRIRAHRNIGASDFAFRCDFRESVGVQSIAGWTRIGCIVEHSGQQYLLLDPLYSILEGTAVFNEAPPETPVERLAAWGRLKSFLPEYVELDAHLRQIQVKLADVFTIRPFLNQTGEPDFDVVAGSQEVTTAIDGEEESTFAEMLTEAESDRFNESFRQRPNAEAGYPVGGGIYVLFTPDCRETLQAVNEVQKASPAIRRAFIDAPQAVLRERLPIDRAADIVSRVFSDDAYSERVRGVGAWKPKVLAWLKPLGENKWIPERIGVRVGDNSIPIEPEDVPELRERLGQAIADGQPAIEYNGQLIPATEEARDVFDHLQGVIKPATVAGEHGDDRQSQDKIVLLVKENLEDLEYLAPPRRTHAEPGTLPSMLPRDYLLPHQEAALFWLQRLWAQGKPGALLADDMGLGKTLEALAMLAWVRDEMDVGTHPRKPVVVIAPTGLLKIWLEEHDKHLEAPGIGQVVEAFGAGLRELRLSHARTGRELAGGAPVLDIDRIREADWVLTTYETWRDYQHSFGRVDFAAAVLDEVQKIKNPRSGVTDAAKAIRSDFIIALTGTPVENRLADLWCIVDAVHPGMLGSLKGFAERYEGSSANAADGSAGELRARLIDGEAPVMLRRLKEDHLDGLPSKRSVLYRRNMPEPQARAYEDVIHRAMSSSGTKGSMLQALHRLKSVSLHPYQPSGESDAEYVAASARLEATIQVLDDLAARQEKALLFVENLEMQGILAGLIQRRYKLKERPLIISGQVSGAKRKDRVDLFQRRRGFDVMILSPKAGGVGLTLTAANHVIHLTRWWNPAVEDQCSDRVFRIGQEKPVVIHYPMAVHPEFGDQTFDVQIDNLLKRKRDLSHSVLAPTRMSDDDMTALFNRTVDAATSTGEINVNNVDLLDPLAFEAWVRDELVVAGFVADLTRQSGDGGADVVGKRPGARKVTIIVQCKHTGSTGRPCDHDGVDAVLAARERYEVSLDVRLVVVTNAGRFSAEAQRRADSGNVELFARSDLGQLRRLST